MRDDTRENITHLNNTHTPLVTEIRNLSASSSDVRYKPYKASLSGSMIELYNCFLNAHILKECFTDN
jgi:hypothetical protein